MLLFHYAKQTGASYMSNTRENWTKILNIVAEHYKQNKNTTLEQTLKQMESWTLIEFNNYLHANIAKNS